MKQISTLAAVLLVTSASIAVAHAEVTLLAPEEIPVLALDDQEVSGGLFRSKSTTYKLDAGTHNITVRYEQFFEHSDGNHDILKSGAVTVPARFDDGKTYQLKLVNPPKNFTVAQEYVNQPIIAIVDSAGTVIAQQQGVDSTPKPWLGSGLFNRVFDLRKDDKNQVRAANSIAPAPVAATTAATTTSTTVTTPVVGGNVAQLKQLWQNATSQERQQFAAWLAEQAAK